MVGVAGWNIYLELVLCVDERWANVRTWGWNLESQRETAWGLASELRYHKEVVFLVQLEIKWLSCGDRAYNWTQDNINSDETACEVLRTCSELGVYVEGQGLNHTCWCKIKQKTRLRCSAWSSKNDIPCWCYSVILQVNDWESLLAVTEGLRQDWRFDSVDVKAWTSFVNID